MTTIAYASPWVPAEWIAAHGLRPEWLRLRERNGQTLIGVNRGVCPYAGAVVDAAVAGLDAAALVLTTACDQMRYAAGLLEQRAAIPIFLMNVPSTWQTAAAREIYRDELQRLGRFLVRLGGKEPSKRELAEVMLAHESARADKPPMAPGRDNDSCATACPGAALDPTLLADHGTANRLGQAVSLGGSSRDNNLPQAVAYPSPTPGIVKTAKNGPVPFLPLAILGGPLLEKDRVIFDVIAQAGGRIVLDATDGGERTRPGPFDPERVWEEPIEALVDAYFGAIPDPMRRPNDAFYDWLGRELAARGVRGVLLWRYLWCDVWHAEAQRLRQWCPVPVLEIDAADDEDCTLGRTRGRIDAFLEMLR